MPQSLLLAGRATAFAAGRPAIWAPPRRQAVGWALQLAQALNYLHQSTPRVRPADSCPAPRPAVRDPLGCILSSDMPAQLPGPFRPLVVHDAVNISVALGIITTPAKCGCGCWLSLNTRDRLQLQLTACLN